MWGDQGFGVRFGGSAYLQDFAVLEYRVRARERPRSPRALKPLWKGLQNQGPFELERFSGLLVSHCFCCRPCSLILAV